MPEHDPEHRKIPPCKILIDQRCDYEALPENLRLCPISQDVYKRQDAYSWSYFLDVRQQGRGYGKRAAQLALRLLRLADPDMPVKLAVEAANTRAQRLYRSLGFRQLPERDGDDLVYAAC